MVRAAFFVLFACLAPLLAAAKSPGPSTVRAPFERQIKVASYCAKLLSPDGSVPEVTMIGSDQLLCEKAKTLVSKGTELVSAILADGFKTPESIGVAPSNEHDGSDASPITNIIRWGIVEQKNIMQSAFVRFLHEYGHLVFGATLAAKDKKYGAWLKTAQRKFRSEVLLIQLQEALGRAATHARVIERQISAVRASIERDAKLLETTGANPYEGINSLLAGYEEVFADLIVVLVMGDGRALAESLEELLGPGLDVTTRDFTETIPVDGFSVPSGDVHGIFSPSRSFIGATYLHKIKTAKDAKNLLKATFTAMHGELKRHVKSRRANYGAVPRDPQELNQAFIDRVAKAMARSGK